MTCAFLVRATRARRGERGLWSPGQNAIARDALTSLGIPSGQTDVLVDAYGYDYPRTSRWPGWYFGVDKNNQQLREFALEALQFTTSDAAPLGGLLSAPGVKSPDSVAAALATRFEGSSLKPALSLSVERAAGAAPRDLATIYRENIERDPQAWDGYDSMARWILISGGKPEEASEVFMSYPGFRDPDPQDPVAMSNRAYRAGLSSIGRVAQILPVLCTSWRPGYARDPRPA